MRRGGLHEYGDLELHKQSPATLAAEEDAVIFSFGAVVDQLKSGMGASAVRSPSAQSVRRRAGPAPAPLPRSAVSPGGASRAPPAQRLHAMSSGAACSVPEPRMRVLYE
jgi:hypothetical protein